MQGTYVCCGLVQVNALLYVLQPVTHTWLVPATLIDHFASKVVQVLHYLTDTTTCAMTGWRTLEASGISPAARGGHSSVVINNQLLVFGGADRTSRTYEDLWALSLGKDDANWTSISAKLPPDVAIKARSGAALVAVGDSVYLFGGQDPSNGLCFNDLLRLDTTSWTWARVAVEGRSPPGRHSCCAVPFREQCLLVFGGAGLQAPLADVWVFDTLASTWTRAGATGCVPAAREMAAGVLLEGDRLAVFGGRAADGRVLDDLCILDCHTWKWTQQLATGLQRCAHTVAWVTAAASAAAPGAQAGTAAAADAVRGGKSQQQHKDTGKGEADSTEGAAADIQALSLDQQTAPAAAAAAAAAAGVGQAATSSGSSSSSAGAEVKSKAARADSSSRPCLLVFGGFSGTTVEGGVYGIDPCSGKVTCLNDASQQQEAAPAARFAHVAGVLQQGKQQVMVIHGGVSPEADLEDVAVWACS